jgi:hypothetical protein
VNLKRISVAFEANATTDSVYRNIQRFFFNFSFTQVFASKAILSFLPKKRKYFLSIDRTNWKFGKSNINILTVGIVYKKVAFPIAWKFLDKRGNSNWEERIEVVSDAIKRLGLQNCKGLLADREFIGIKWVSWLVKENIPFWVRVKKNTSIETIKGKKISVSKIFKSIKNKPKHYKNSLTLFGESLYISAVKSGKNPKEKIIIISNNSDSSAIEIYKKRWAIETLFGFLKSKGFDLEATHMTDFKKLESLFGLISIAFAWAFFIGEFLEKENPTPIKKHGRKAISTFRVGLDFLQKLFLNSLDLQKFLFVLQFLPCT